ncbi:MAG: serine protease [Acidobacteria bacterium]|nr:MAG: serine protease [Acidobacteriota bacterium]
MVERLAEKQSGSVGLILGEYIWIDQATGQPLRYEEGETPGTIRPWSDGHISVGIGGRGPVVVREFSGTGFLVDAAGRVLTSGYLLAPWERDPIARQAHTMGLRPRLRLLHIYFPSVDRPFDLKIIAASDRGEAVLCQFDPGPVRLTPLSLPSGGTNVLTGAPIVLLGYPGGVELIAARLPEAALRGIEVSTLRTHDELAQRLARAGLIRPLAIGGRISGQYHGRLFYDGTTTFGASGGPLLNARGEVIGIEFAISPEFSGSNLAIPIKSLQRWLVETGVGLPRSEQAEWRPVPFQ